MRKIIVGLLLGIALIAGGTYLSACKSTAPASGDSTVVVDSIKKDTVKADSVKADSVKADSVKADSVKIDTAKKDTAKSK